ncbi:MAG TPA: hypothetical protein VHQ90_05295 [Thermoanaerobaculia bacterium]|nr:hypothetical protein [Thermoanaerobaculia bacterium]
MQQSLARDGDSEGAIGFGLQLLAAQSQGAVMLALDAYAIEDWWGVELLGGYQPLAVGPQVDVETEIQGLFDRLALVVDDMKECPRLGGESRRRQQEDREGDEVPEETTSSPSPEH